jgi:hypothetical protein
MSEETIVTSAFRVHRSKFSCLLAAALHGTGRVPGRRVYLGRLSADGWNNRQGWAGEKSSLFGHPAQSGSLSLMYGYG